MFLADAITGETGISIGLLLSVLIPTLGAAVGAIVASVTTRNKVASLSDDMKEFQQWRNELRKQHASDNKELSRWKSETDKTLAIIQDRSGRASRPLPKATR